MDNRRSALQHVIYLFRSAVVWSTLAWISPSLAQPPPQLSPHALAEILAPPSLTPIMGNSHGDVTIVEYFDYACPVCKRTDLELQKLVNGDSKVRIVYKDWPIFGAVSVYAAYCTFAAAELKQFPLAHHALMNVQHRLDSNEVVDAALREAGLDLGKIKSLIDAHKAQFSETLTRNDREATALRLRGTPGLIIGDVLIGGGLDYAQMRSLISKSRHASSIPRP
jgi:protein-disulfide isomerase